MLNIDHCESLVDPITGDGILKIVLYGLKDNGEFIPVHVTDDGKLRVKTGS